MARLLIALTVVIFHLSLTKELTFELPDNKKMCFYENIEQGEQATLEFQVITGGNYDVDMELTGPNSQVLYKDVKKNFDGFTWTAQQKGVYTFCFSNEFSTFTHKVVYFDLQVGDERPAAEELADHQTPLTLMETSTVNIFKNLKTVLDYKARHRLLESEGRVFAEDLNQRVLYWSIGESLLIILIGIGQILVRRSFFTLTRHRQQREDNRYF